MMPEFAILALLASLAARVLNQGAAARRMEPWGAVHSSQCSSLAKGCAMYELGIVERASPSQVALVWLVVTLRICCRVWLLDVPS